MTKQKIIMMIFLYIIKIMKNKSLSDIYQLFMNSF